MLGKKAEHIASLYVTGLLMLAIIGVLIVNYSPEVLKAPTGNVVHGLSDDQGVRNLQVFFAYATFGIGAILIVGGSTLAVRLMRSAQFKRKATPGAVALRELHELEKQQPEPATEPADALGPVPEPPESPPLPEQKPEPAPEPVQITETESAAKAPTPTKRKFRFFSKEPSDPIDRRIADIDRRLRELDRRIAF